MAIKTFTSDFGGTYKGYIIQTDDGCVSNHDPESHAVDINEEGVLFPTTNELMRAYGDTHALNVKEGADGRAWPANICVQEHDFAVVALRMSCMDTSRLMNAALKNNDTTLPTEFIRAASAVLGCEASEIVHASDVYAYSATTVKKQDWSGDDIESHDASLNDIAQRIMNGEVQDSVIVHSESFEDVTRFAHAFVMGNELLTPGFMARNAHVYLATMFARSTTSPTELPVPQENTTPCVKILQEMQKLGL